MTWSHPRRTWYNFSRAHIFLLFNHIWWLNKAGHGLLFSETVAGSSQRALGYVWSPALFVFQAESGRSSNDGKPRPQLTSNSHVQDMKGKTYKGRWKATLPNKNIKAQFSIIMPRLLLGEVGTLMFYIKATRLAGRGAVSGKPVLSKRFPLSHLPNNYPDAPGTILPSKPQFFKSLPSVPRNLRWIWLPTFRSLQSFPSPFSLLKHTCPFPQVLTIY